MNKTRESELKALAVLMRMGISSRAFTLPDSPLPIAASIFLALCRDSPFPDHRDLSALSEQLGRAGLFFSIENTGIFSQGLVDHKHLVRGDLPALYDICSLLSRKKLVIWRVSNPFC
jgi:hypothetical protein